MNKVNVSSKKQSNMLNNILGGVSENSKMNEIKNKTRTIGEVYKMNQTTSSNYRAFANYR